MMAHNLCYTTLLDSRAVAALKLVKDEDYIITPNNGQSSELPLQPVSSFMQTFS